MTITEDHITRLMSRANQRYDVKEIDIRSPFDGKPTGLKMVYRADNKEIFKAHTRGLHTITSNLEANKIFSKMSEITPMKLVSGFVFDGGRTSVTFAKFGTDQTGKFKVGGGQGRGRGEYIEKRLALVNYHESGRIRLFVVPHRYRLKYSEPMYLHPRHTIDWGGNSSPNDILRYNGSEIDIALTVEEAKRAFDLVEQTANQMFDKELSPALLMNIMQVHVGGNTELGTMVKEQYYKVPKTFRNSAWNIYTILCGLKQAELNEYNSFMRTFMEISHSILNGQKYETDLTIEEIFDIFST